MIDIQFSLYFAIGGVLCLVFGSIMSIPSLWKSMCSNPEIYLKAGEYGETELDNRWSVFKEPWNAWTSLAYSIFGFAIFFTGVIDQYEAVAPQNNISSNSGFSIHFGASCIYLGVASFLFHASHSEVWRKADAGMTSGVMVAPLAFAIWDRARPPAASSTWLVFSAVILQLSFTHGYLPYGSSDYLLPGLIATCWSLELLPRYGGAVDSYEFNLWWMCFYGAIGGMLLRATDINRKSQVAFSNTIRAFFVVSTIPFGYAIGFTSPVILTGFVSGAIVYLSPAKGHICWHVFSAFGLFIWWYLLRTRSGDPVGLITRTDTQLIAIGFFVAVKNAVRRLFMNLPVAVDLRNRLFYLLEHTFFTVWGWWVLVVIPGQNDSWLVNPIQCWFSPVFPFELFHLYYQVKVATHVEDLLFIATMYILEKRAPKAVADADAKRNSAGPSASNRDVKMDIHHIATAVLCLSSYLAGYSKIGSIVMFLHDASDLPLDLLRLCTSLRWSYAQAFAYAITVVFWFYWRLWYFPTSVLWSVAKDSKSLHWTTDCVPGACTWQESPERLPFIVLLGTLQALHVVWFIQLLKKGYRVLFCAPITSADDN